MEVAVAGGAVGTTIKVLLQNLLSFTVEEIGLLWNFNKDLQKLRNSIIMIQNFLEDAEMKQVADKPLIYWLMKLEAVAYDADYVFDQLNYELLRKKMKKKVTKMLGSALVQIIFRHKMARKINNIKKELKLINQEATGLGLQTRIVVAQAPANDESDALSVDPIFVGRENDVENIVKMVTTAPTEQVIYVLPIVGMGGVGKTTLARKVLNDAKITSHFGELCFWVHVGLDFVPEIVLKKILELTGDHVGGSKEVVLRKLRKSFGDRRYLLVLDNFWDKDRVKWENFMNSLKGISHVKGNVIIVTTREGNAALIVKEHDVHELEVLSEDDCWSIIKAKAFREEGTKSFGFNIANNIPSEFETVGKNIAEKCGGLPLAAQVVGSLLCDKSIDEWVTIEKNWHSSFGGHGNTVSKMLKLSFDHLSSPSLKKCFMFYSIIPKSWCIYKDELIHLWMAERLIQSDQEKDLENVGNTMFNILLESSLLQVHKRDIYGNVTSCFMHDLVHDLASSILNSKIPEGAHQVRYKSIPLIDESSPPILAKCLRALFFGGKISHIKFSNMKRLHVLILTDGEMNVLPNEIGKLISLRFLDISHTRIKCLPDSIGDLYHLQTLRATVEHGGPSYLEKLPDTFKFLISLRHLYIPNIKLPMEIGKLISLQTLPYFQVDDKEGCRITELESLKNLKGEIEIHNLEKVCDKEEAKSADLFHKPNILKLKLVWNESRDHMTNDEDVLEGLQPHWNLKILEIIGFKGRSFPLWTFRMEVRENIEDCWIRLDNLLEIQLSDCKECEEIPMLGHLPRLKYLYLRHLPNVKRIGSSFYGIKGNEVNDTEKKMVFPALEKLELIGMKSLTAWNEVELDIREVFIFHRLEFLKIKDCRQLKSAPSHFPCLKELEIDNMESCVPLASICGSNLTSLKYLQIHKVDGLISLPDGLFNNNQDLLELDIRDCNNLMHLVLCLGGGGASLKTLVIKDCMDFKEFPEDLHKLIALEELRILSCPNLKSIPYPSGGQLSPQGFTSLRSLCFVFCSRLTFLPCEMLESCSLSLEEFHLSGSKSLANLAQVMSLLQNIPRLTSLGVKDVPKVTNLAAEISSLRSLQTLAIGAPPDCYEYHSFKAILDRIFPVLQSLRYLSLKGMQQWDALPEQLQQLTSLHELIIEDFGIQVLPEWIENFSSLTLLCVWRCPELRCLASKKAMSGLTKLTEFEISDCPLLKQNLEQQASSDSEWYKISHISNIIVDDRSISAQAH